MSRPLRIDYPNSGTMWWTVSEGERTFLKKIDKEVPASRELAPDLDTIITEVSRYYEISPNSLKAVRRGIENEPRNVAMYLIRSMRSEPLIKVGAGFGSNRYSSVSSAVRKLGFIATELSKKLGVLQPSVSISVKRGERIAKAEQFELVESYNLMGLISENKTGGRVYIEGNSLILNIYNKLGRPFLSPNLNYTEILWITTYIRSPYDKTNVTWLTPDKIFKNRKSCPPVWLLPIMFPLTVEGWHPAPHEPGGAPVALMNLQNDHVWTERLITATTPSIM